MVLLLNWLLLVVLAIGAYLWLIQELNTFVFFCLSIFYVLVTKHLEYKFIKRRNESRT